MADVCYIIDVMRTFRATLIIAALLLTASTLTSCGSSPVAVAAKLLASSPYPALSSADITYLGASGFSGSDEAVANSILSWQKSKMHLATPAEKSDVSYAMRWNNIMPGIYPVSDMIRDKVLRVGRDTLIYGVCWDFAAIYISVAKYYGLETRMTAWKTFMSGVPGGQKGLGPDEYNALKVLLDENGLSFSYELVNSVIKETYIHYRAEVKIDGVWKAFDGTSPTGEYADDSNYTAVAWDEGLSSVLARK